MLMFRLYYAPGTCALATHIALEEAGTPYEAVPVDFGSQAQRSPAYLAINPKGRVPALVTESGTLTETPGLLLFVAQRFPNAELAPLSDPFALAQVQEFNSYLCSTVHVAHAHGRRGARWADDAAAIRGDEAQGARNDGGMLRADRTQALEGSVGHGRAVHDLRPVPVHDWHLDRRRRGRHNQIAARHGPPQTHAGKPGGAKSRGHRRDPNLLDQGTSSPFSHYRHGGCRVRKERHLPPRSTRDGRRALPCR